MTEPTKIIIEEMTKEFNNEWNSQNEHTWDRLFNVFEKIGEYVIGMTTAYINLGVYDYDFDEIMKKRIEIYNKFLSEIK